jgi:RNA polymerase sigma-70 factor, ECF subfamily
MWTAEAAPIFHARTKTVALAYPLTMPALARTPIRGNMPLRRPSYSARRLRESVTLGSLGNDTGNSGESTLRALLERCAQGDRQAFRTLYDMQAPRMHGLAMRITRDTALAADATHDAFIQVWRQSVRFDPERGAAGAWLTSIVRYRALDIARRRIREKPGYEPPEQEDESPDALSQMISSTEGAALHRCLDQLEPDRRKLILRAYADGLSHSELSESMGTPLGTIKSWIRRALIALKECLSP